MTKSLDKFGTQVKVARPRVHKNLAMYPLLAPETQGPEYITLPEALASGSVEIKEVSQEGSVSDLLLINKGDRAVLILDGEEVVGAKQNRVVNTTILVAANTTLIIPVTCVEEGRWSRKSDNFESGDSVMFCRARRNQAEEVHKNLAIQDEARGDQHETWDDIRAKSGRLGAHSETGAMSDLFEHLKNPIEDYVSSLGLVDMQVGAAFAVNGKLVGLDCISRQQAYGVVHKMLIKSYALDAIDEYQSSDHQPPSETDVVKLLMRLSSAPYQKHAGVGLGNSLRFHGPDLVVAALEEDDVIVHICAFMGNGKPVCQKPAGGRMQRAFKRIRRNLH